jgi:hypothetical protein
MIKMRVISLENVEEETKLKIIECYITVLEKKFIAKINNKNKFLSLTL